MSHIAHIARQHKIPASDVRAGMNAVTPGAAAIRSRILARGGNCTIAASRERWSAAQPAVLRLLAEEKLGLRRRHAEVAPLTIEERQSAQIAKIVGPRGRYYSGVTDHHYFSGDPAATTVISTGDAYSGSWHTRRDAIHTITAKLSDLRRVREVLGNVYLDDCCVLKITDSSQGYYLADVVARVGKRIACQHRYIARVQTAEGGHWWGMCKSRRIAMDMAMSNNYH